MRIEAQDLAADYGGREIFAGVNFTLHNGEILYAYGKNGSGKSTLVKILAGVKEPSAGNLIFDHPGSPGCVRSFAAPFFQIPPRLRLNEIISMCAFTSDERLRCGKYLSLFNIPAASKKHLAGSLSSGTAQKLKLALTAARSADLYLFDEPLVFLDEDSRGDAAILIDECRSRGALMITAGSHGMIFGSGKEVDLDAHIFAI